MDVATLDRRNLCVGDARAIATLLVAIWPKPGRTIDTLADELLTKQRHYAGPESQYPRLFVVRHDGRVIACSSAVPRMIGTAAGEMTVLALARVCTDPHFRGKHLGQTVVRAAFELVDDGSYPFSLFQTGPSVRPFYEKLGAVKASNHFINSLADDPCANPFWDTEIMRYPGKPGWPAGQIDLRGPAW
jgi:predicted N-acetyltransferase YhbS